MSQNKALLPCVIVEHNPSQKAITHSVIWLHGLGADGHDFASIVPMLGLGDDMAVRFVFPHAPKMPITIFGGEIVPAWYDIYERSLDRKVDKVQIERSSAWIDELIEHQMAQGVPSQNIVIAGFSQGGAVAYHTVLSSTKKLGGLLALSTYFATKSDIATPLVNDDIAVNICHGVYDDVVPLVLAEQALAQLHQLGLEPEFHRYPMMHAVCPQQITQIGQWLTALYQSAE